MSFFLFTFDMIIRIYSSFNYRCVCGSTQLCLKKKNKEKPRDHISALETVAHRYLYSRKAFHAKVKLTRTPFFR